MYLPELFKLVLRNVSREKSRSFLTLLGVVVGMAAVVGLLSISGGLRLFISGTLNKLGEDIIIIFPGGGSGMTNIASTTSSNVFDDSDLLTVRNVQGVKEVWARAQKPYIVEYDEEQLPLMVVSIASGNLDLFVEREFLTLEKGRMINEKDAHSVLVPKEMAEESFDKEIQIGHTLTINEESFRVVGIVSMPSGLAGQNAIFTPLKTARDVFGDERVSMITVQASGDLAEVAERIERKLERTRGEDTFSIATQKDVAKTVGNIITVADVVLVGVAAVSLVIGGLGIMNTMYMSISEKTREIGIMKAIGATNKTISLMFLMESGLVGLMGGAVGSLLGYMMGKLVESTIANSLQVDFHIVVTPPLLAGVLLFSSVLGMFAGSLPVREAIKLKPVEAMR